MEDESEKKAIDVDGHPQKLGGNDIRTPKMHALPTIPETIVQLGSTGNSTTSFFEEKHRGTKGHYELTNKHHVSHTENRVLASANAVRFSIADDFSSADFVCSSRVPRARNNIN